MSAAEIEYGILSNLSSYVILFRTCVFVNRVLRQRTIWSNRGDIVRDVPSYFVLGILQSTSSPWGVIPFLFIVCLRPHLAYDLPVKVQRIGSVLTSASDSRLVFSIEVQQDILNFKHQVAGKQADT